MQKTKRIRLNKMFFFNEIMSFFSEMNINNINNNGN